MDYNNPPFKKKQNKQPRGWFDRTTVKPPDTWRYGKKTKAQWIEAFEQEAKH